MKSSAGIAASQLSADLGASSSWIGAPPIACSTGTSVRLTSIDEAMLNETV